MLKISRASRFTLLAVFSAALFCVSGAVSARAETLLRFKFTPDTKLKYECRQTMNNDMVVEDKTMSSKVESTMELSQQVKSVDEEGKATVEVSINRVKMSMTMPMGQAIEYDSAAEKQDEGMGKLMAEQFDKILNKPIEMKIDSLGTISDVKLPEGMAAKDGVGALLGGDNMKQMLGGISFPKEAVTDGKTWTAASSMPAVPGMGKGSIEQTFKYLGGEKKDGAELAKIELSAVIDMKPQDGAAVKMSLKDQETKGDILFDNNAGRIQSSTTKSKMSFDMEMMGKKMTNSVETTVEVKLMPEAVAKTPAEEEKK